MLRRFIAPAGIVGMSLAVDFVSLVSRRSVADSGGDIDWPVRDGGLKYCKLAPVRTRKIPEPIRDQTAVFEPAHAPWRPRLDQKK